jgi:hypothetical protein
MFTRQEFFAKLICCVESAGGVNEAQWRGAHLWPLYRIALIDAVNRIDYTPYAAAVDAAYLAQRPEFPDDCDPAETEPPPPQSVGGPAESGAHLYYASAEDHFFITDQGLRAPIIDGWVDLSVRLGGALKIEMAHRLGGAARARPSLAMAYPTAHEVERFAERLSRDDEYQAAAARARRAFTGVADACAPGLAASLDIRFDETFARTLAMKEAFGRVVDGLRPGAAFVVCWYGLSHAALVWACNERGIPTAEIAHSGIPEFHHGYSHLSSIPPEGYLMLPRTFLCWDYAAANAVMRWIPAAGRAVHRALAAGPPHFAAAARPSAAAAALDRHIASGRWARRILVGLGGDEDSGLTPLTAAAMASAPTDWLWLVRCHPLHADGTAPNISPGQVAEILRARGVMNFEVDATTACAAVDALDRADHHVTAMSTLAFDALHRGVPTTFTGAMAAGLYGWLRRRRLAYFVSDASGLLDSIRAGIDGLDGELIARFFRRSEEDRLNALRWAGSSRSVPPSPAAIPRR